MVSPFFSRTIHSIIEKCCQLQVLPYTYDLRAHKLRRSAELQLVPFFLLMFALGAYSTFLVLRIATSVAELKKHFEEFCISMFLVIFISDEFVFIVNFWMKRREIAWLFNQVREINEQLEEQMSAKPNPVELLISTWPYGHFAMFSSVVLSFLLGPTKLQYVHSLLPAEYHSGRSVALFFCLEVVVWGAAMTTVTAELLLQAYALRSCIWYTEVCIKISNKSIDKTVKLYRKTAIVLTNFTYCFGAHIEQLKTTVTIALVFINYGLIRKFSEMHNIFDMMMLVTSCIVGHLMPPLMYNSGYAVHTNSHEIRRRLLMKVAMLTSADGDGRRQQYLKRKVGSLRPLYVKVMGMYFLDRTMTPLYYMIITSYTVSFLLMFS